MTQPVVFHGHDGYQKVLVAGSDIEISLFVGLDLGQVNDSSALVVAEKRKYPTHQRKEPTYHLRHIQRWLDLSYVALVAEVAALFARSPLDTARALVIDGTGVGRPVVDMFRKAALPCRIEPVSITGGDIQHMDELPRWWYVPKRDLVSAAQVLLEDHRLEIASRLPEAATLVAELQAFRYKLSPAGHDSYNAREGAHDDVLLAACLAIWGADHHGVTRWF
jgi:hypothetical protein